MAFYPVVNQEIRIFGDAYYILPHPLVDDIPYGQEGRQAIVYALAKRGGQNTQQLAIKVFKSGFRSHRLNKLARDLTPLAQIPGLSVCHRTVLTSENSSELLGQYPDLNNAMLMPWILGPTWVDMLLDRREISKQESFNLALSLVNTLADMETMGIAHCDLSAANIIIPALAGNGNADRSGSGLVELVDVEQIYSQQFEKPEALPGGSPGYAHIESNTGLWAPYADRYAGALLLAEILTWSDAGVRDAAWGESYFDPGEMHKPSERYLKIKKGLESQWGGTLSRLFTRAWESGSLSACPDFKEWRTEIKAFDPSSAVRAEPKAPVIHTPAPQVMQGPKVIFDSSSPEVNVLMQLGRKLAQQSNFDGAIEAYNMAIDLLPVGNPLIKSLHTMIADIKSFQSRIQGSNVSDHRPLSAAMRNSSIIRTDNQREGRININKDLFILGRSQSADHIIMDSGISRIHMEFINVQNRIAARDLNSTNGTYINGQRIEPYALYFVNNGDRIRLANVEYEFQNG